MKMKILNPPQEPKSDLADLRAHILGLRTPDQTDTTEANCIRLSLIHIGLVPVEADEVSRNPGIGTVSMAAKPVAFQPLRRK